MKAHKPHDALWHPRRPAPTLRERVRHLCGLIAALSLLLVSTTVWAQLAPKRDGDRTRLAVGFAPAPKLGAFEPPNAAQQFSPRVELQFRENRSKLGFDHGHKALGLQLDGNSRLMLRAKHGGPMVYYRSTW